MKSETIKFEADREIISDGNIKLREKMPIKAEPFVHKIKAFEFVCNMFGLVEGGASDDGGLSSMWKEDQ